MFPENKNNYRVKIEIELRAKKQMFDVNQSDLFGKGKGKAEVDPKVRVHS